MNYELLLKYRKNLKNQYLKGNLTKEEYEKSLESLRPKKKGDTLLNKIKNYLKL